MTLCCKVEHIEHILPWAVRHNKSISALHIADARNGAAEPIFPNDLRSAKPAVYVILYQGWH